MQYFMPEPASSACDPVKKTKCVWMKEWWYLTDAFNIQYITNILNKNISSLCIKKALHGLYNAFAVANKDFPGDS